LKTTVPLAFETPAGKSVTDPDILQRELTIHKWLRKRAMYDGVEDYFAGGEEIVIEVAGDPEIDVARNGGVDGFRR
jgi:hypothetical protein